MFTGLDNPTHWLFIAIVAVIIFGPKRLPELGRSLGSGLRGFKDSLGGSGDEPERPSEMVEARAADAGENAAPAATPEP